MTTAPSPPLSRRRRDAAGREYGLWFVVAIVLHVVVGLFLWFFTPLREMIAQAVPDEPERVVSTSKIEEIDDFVQAANERQLRAQVAELERLREMMADLEAEQEAAYEPIAEQQREAAPAAMEDALAQAEAAMADAMAALGRDDADAAAKAQARAEDQQERAAAQLGLLGEPAADVLDAQRQAAETQRSASEAHGEAGDFAGWAEGLKTQINDLETTVAEQRAEAEKTRRWEDEAAEARDEQAAEVGRQRDAAAQKRSEKEAAIEAKDGEARKAAAQAEREANDAANRADRERAKRDREANEARRQAERAEGRVAEAEAVLPERREKRDELAATVELRREQARERQAAAIEQQAAVAEAMRAAAADLLADGPAVENPASTDRPDLDALTAAALMGRAAEVERDLAEAYRRTRAMRLAPVLGLTLGQAVDKIDVTIPDREALDADALEQEARNAAEIDAKKAEFAKAQQQAAGMTDLANLLLLKAQQEVRRNADGGSSPAPAVTSGDMTGGDETLEKLASVDASGNSADLTAAMADLLGIEAEFPGDPTPPVIDEDVVPLSGRRVASVGDRASGWMAVTDWWVIGPYDNAGRRNIDRKFDPENVVDLSAVYPAAGKQGQDLSWTFHTSWHRDDRGLEEGETPKFPQWVAAKPFNTEPYGIWYAYTEIEMPADGEAHAVWMAFGSDDKGKVWLLDDTAGDVLIWESASHHKGWTPGEAVRRVLLRPGVNRLLFRIENGWMDMDWSLMLAPDTAGHDRNEARP